MINTNRINYKFDDDDGNKEAENCERERRRGNTNGTNNGPASS